MADDTAVEPIRVLWLTPAVGGIGVASFLSDASHEVSTSLLPRLLLNMGAGPAALGVIEGVSDGLAGLARLAGGPLADDPGRRRAIAVGGYATTAVLTSLTGAVNSPVQVGALRGGAWAARGVRVPARNALLADVTPPAAYGRAFGFERAMDNLGAIVGPLLALLLVAVVGTRTAIGLAVIPGLLAAVAVAYAIRHAPPLAPRSGHRLRLVVGPLLHGRLGRLLVGVTAFELGNPAATLLILRATALLGPGRSTDSATKTALALYLLYNLTASIVSLLAGRAGDRHGPARVLILGVLVSGAAYALFAMGVRGVVVLGVAFMLGGASVGLVETAESAAVAAAAPEDLRGSAFGLLAVVQSGGNLVASSVTGVLWAAFSPAVAFTYLATCMAGAIVVLLRMARQRP